MNVAAPVIEVPVNVQAVGEVTSPAVAELREQVVEPGVVSNPDPVILIMVPAGPSNGDTVTEGTENDAGLDTSAC